MWVALRVGWQSRHLVGRLTALKVAKVKTPGMYADGAGLYLQVSGDGENTLARSWIFRFTLRGRSREMGLGSVSLFGLAEARAKAAECRRQTCAGIDPIEVRRAQRVQAALEAATALTFKDCTEQYLAAYRAGWRNAKHAARWSSTLKTYAEPVIGVLAVQSIDTALVMKIIEPLWSKKPETASRLRGRIEAVLDWATVRGFRQVRIRHAGVVISTSCCRRAPRCARSSPMLRCPMTNYAHS